MLSSSDSDEDLLYPNSKRRKIYKDRVHCAVDDFEARFRLSREQFDFVLSRIHGQISHPTGRSAASSPHEQLLLTMRFLATGSFYTLVGDCHGFSKSTVCRAIQRCIYAINNELFHEIVQWPDNISGLATKFYSVAQMPGVCGCIDGTHIPIEAPTDQYHEHQFVNRKGVHSINVMAVCGPEMKFFYVSSRWPGSVNDARVFRNSSLHDRFEEGWRPFPNAVLLGDSAYPCKDYIIPPLSIANSECERRFNTSHKKTRRLIENSFGILKERFSCLYGLRVNPRYAGDIIKTCCVLHNICRINGEHCDLSIGSSGNDDPSDSENDDTTNDNSETMNQGSSRRDALIQRFRSDFNN